MREATLREFEAFVAVAEAGSFVGGARALGITPSSMSQVIRRLEERTGLQLFHRTTRSVSPTDVGLCLLERLRRAFEEIDAASRDLADRRSSPAGTVRLAVPRVAYHDLIAPNLAALNDALPDVVLDVRIDDAFVDVVADGYDLGVRLGDYVSQDVVAVPIGPSLRQVVVGSPAYLRRHGTPTHPRELTEHRCINWRQNAGEAPYAWEFARNGEEVEVAVGGPLVVSDRGCGIRAAVDGLGLAMWVEHRVRDLIKGGALVPVLEDWSAPYPGFFLYYYRDRYMSSATRAVAALLRDRTAAAARDVHEPPGSAEASQAGRGMGSG